MLADTRRWRQLAYVCLIEQGPATTAYSHCLLAAHTVVIKGVWGFQDQGLAEYSDLNIMQMLGRAVWVSSLSVCTISDPLLFREGHSLV